MSPHNNSPGIFPESIHGRQPVIAFIVLCILIVIGVTYSLSIYHRLRAEMEAETIAADQAQVEMGAQFIADHQTGLLSVVKAVTANESFREALFNMDIAGLEKSLFSLISNSPELSGAVVVDQSGQIIHKVKADHGNVPPNQWADGWPDQAHPDPEPGISLISNRSEESEPAGVVVHVPVIGPSGKPAAILAVYQSLEFWSDYFSRLTARSGREYLIVDGKGTWIVGGKTVRQLLDLSGLNLFEPDRNRSGPATKMTRGREGSRMLLSHRSIPSLNWTLIISHNHETAMAPMQAMFRNLVLFLLMLFFCLAGLAFLIVAADRAQKRALQERDEAARRFEELVKERTADLSETMQRYRSLLTELPDVVYELDSDERLVFVSKASVRLLGYQPEELLGRPWWELITEEDRPRFLKQKNMAEEGGVLSIDALRHATKQGQLKWISINSRGLVDEKGKPSGRLGIARDVSNEILGRERIRQLSRRLIQTQEEERKRLALDLHDEMGQLLSALKIGLQALPLGDPPPPGLAEDLSGLIDLSQGVMNKVRTLAYNLRPAILDRFGLVPAIEDLAESVAETAKIDIRLSLAEAPESAFSSEVKTTFFRFIQEALTNAVRHSGSREVEVSLEYESGRMISRVQDFGRGFDVEAVLNGIPTPRGLGLLGMKERMGLIGGDLEIRSDAGGSTLTATKRIAEH